MMLTPKSSGGVGGAPPFFYMTVDDTDDFGRMGASASAAEYYPSPVAAAARKRQKTVLSPPPLVPRRLLMTMMDDDDDDSMLFSLTTATTMTANFDADYLTVPEIVDCADVSSDSLPSASFLCLPPLSAMDAEQDRGCPFSPVADAGLSRFRLRRRTRSEASDNGDGPTSLAMMGGLTLPPPGSPSPRRRLVSYDNYWQDNDDDDLDLRSLELSSRSHHHQTTEP